MSTADLSPVPKRQTEEDEGFEWESSNMVTTTWAANKAVASSSKQGRRAYGSRANRGPSRYASSGAAALRARQQAQAARFQNQSSTEEGSGARMEKLDDDSPQRGTGVAKKTASLDFNLNAVAAAAVSELSAGGKFPPRPSAATFDGHGRSHSMNSIPTPGAQGRPPFPATHQRTSSLTPSPSGLKVMFGSGGNGWPSLPSLDTFERENHNPNFPSASGGGGAHSASSTPNKIFGVSSAPSSAAPSPQDLDDEIRPDDRGRRGRKKKSRTCSDSDAAAAMRPLQSSPHSSTSSFSSLSKKGDGAPQWIKRSLQDVVSKNTQSAVAASSPLLTKSGGVLMNRSRSLSSSTASSFNSAASRGKRRGGHMSATSLDFASEQQATNLLSPPRSVGAGSTASSRKRGVCDSPVLDLNDDSAAVYSPSMSSGVMSSSSRRSKARSRIFSPDSTKKKMMAAAKSVTCGIFDHDFLRGGGSPEEVERRRAGRKRGSLFRGESDHEDSDDSDEEHSVNKSNVNESVMTDASEPALVVVARKASRDDEDDNPRVSLFGPGGDRKGKLEVSPPPRHYRRNSSMSQSFAESVFASVDGGSVSSPQRNNKAKDNDFAENSKRDAAEKGSGEEDDPLSTISSYDDLKYMIKALRKWSRGKNFATFGVMRGCTIVMPNTWDSSRKAAFMRWATNGLGFNLRPGGSGVAFFQTTADKGTAILQDLEAKLVAHKSKMGKSCPTRTADTNKEEAQLVFIASAPLVKASRNDVPRSVVFPQVEKDIDSDLLMTFDSLALDKPESAPLEAKKSPLVRTVTLEPASANKPPDPLSSLPCFAPMSVSPKENSFEVARRGAPRHSGEHSAGGIDLMQHIHGAFSPDDTPRNMIRRQRFSSASQPRSVCQDSYMSAVDEVEATPAPVGSARMARLVMGSPSFEVNETPAMEKGPGFWGSRPVAGKDWGCSKKCEATILAMILERQAKAFSESEYCGPSALPMITSQMSPAENGDKFVNYAPESSFVHPIITETAVNSQDLGFDLEADDVNSRRGKSARVYMDDSDEDQVEDDEEEDAFDDKMDMVDSRQTSFQLQRGKSSSLAFSRGITLSRQSSIGASALSALAINEDGPSPDKLEKRRKMSLAVRRRMSLCAAAFEGTQKRRFTTAFGLPSISSPMEEFGRKQTLVPNRRQTILPGATERADQVLNDPSYLSTVLSYLTENELLLSASLVQISWGEAAAEAHASLMLVSVGCQADEDNKRVSLSSGVSDLIGADEELQVPHSAATESIARSMERSWQFLTCKFPWATFLSEGAFKRVYRVWNATVSAEEAVSVMDVEAIDDMGNKEIVGAELSVSVLLSSLVRRNVCPNFVLTRGVFTCPFEPPSSHWGCADNKKPNGNFYDPERSEMQPESPNDEEQGKFQYIRMELCRHGDVEEFLQSQDGKSVEANEARMLLFQMAFALHTAADRYSLKHYDVKLLNFFLQSAHAGGECVNEIDHPFTVLRYGMGSHVFGLRMPTSRALIAKLADYGTANIQPESNGQPVTIGQFTTLENSPPDYLISGDSAQQGYGHDNFGLGLCMLHLFTGDAPYEEILADVVCPTALKRKLKNIWEHHSSSTYGVVRSVILADVYEDETGIIEGEADEILYDTLYRYLVLFGIPDKKLQSKDGARVWRAIMSALVGQDSKQSATTAPTRRSRRNMRHDASSISAFDSFGRIPGPDTVQFEKDQAVYSLLKGSDRRIASARDKLTSMDGGMELLMSLVSFDHTKRATPLEVINSVFMAPLREEPGINVYEPTDLIAGSYMQYHYSDRGLVHETK